MPYRLLTKADVVQEDDEYLEDDCEEWSKVGHNWATGRLYIPGVQKPIRRFELADPPRVFGRKVMAMSLR